MWNMRQRLGEILACQPDFLTIMAGTNDWKAIACQALRLHRTEAVLVHGLLSGAGGRKRCTAVTCPAALLWVQSQRSAVHGVELVVCKCCDSMRTLLSAPECAVL